MADVTEAQWIARQVACNTDSGQHSEGCIRRRRPAGELFTPAVACTCHVVHAALAVITGKTT